MPRDLFGDVTRPSVSIGNRKWYSVPVSLFSHAAIIVAVVVAPLLAAPFLPKPSLRIGGVVIPVTAVPTPPPRPRPAELKPVANPDAAPIDVPDGITPEKPSDFDISFQDIGTPNIADGIGNIDSIITPPPPAPPPVEQKPLRVGSVVRAPQKIRDVQPVYPHPALLSRTEGVVIIEATIGVDGRVINTRVLRSANLLDNAALEAVRQWEFTPTLLNGVPVPVIMTVTVNFSLRK
jgi:protein TonB